MNNMDGSNGKRTREDSDQFDIDNDPVRESLASTTAATAANDERGEDHHHLALMDDDPQQRAGSRPTPERSSQMNVSFTVVSPRKKQKSEEEDQVDVNDEQRNVFKTEAAAPEAAEQIVTVSEPAAAKTDPVVSVLTEGHESSSDYQKQQRQQNQQSDAIGEHAASRQQQHQNTQQQTSTEAVLDVNGTDRKQPSTVARNLFDTSVGDSDSDSDKPHLGGTAIRFRENKDDDWQTGTIVDVAAGEIMDYKVLPHWSGKSFKRSYKTERVCVGHHWCDIFNVKNSNQFFQRLSKSELVELEDRICSEFDRLLTSHDLEVTFAYIYYKYGGCYRITAKPSEDNWSLCSWECIYTFTDVMLMRVGASFRRHCCELKRCEFDNRFCNHFSREALMVLVQGIVTASNPAVTTLCLTDMDKETLDYVCKSLLSEKTHMLRELQLKRCTIPSLGFLQGLFRSLRVFDFEYCILRYRCWHDLDEFFKMQMGMKDPVLQCLKFVSRRSAQDLPRILDSLRRHDFLKAFHLTKHFSSIDSNVALHVQQFLQATKVLQKLRLDFDMDDAACRTISAGLARCASLQELIIPPISFDRQKVMTIVSALVQQAEDSQQRLRFLKLPLNEHTTDDVRDVLEQLRRLPALRHFHLDGFCCQLCNKILLDALEHSLMLEKFEYAFFDPPMKASVDSLCRANRILNRHIPQILDAPEDVPPYLWSMILASVSPKAIGLFQLLRGYPNIADPKFLQTVVKKK